MRIVSRRRSRRLPQQERPAWITEANRLARIVEHYAGLRPKRKRHAITGHYEFVPDAFALCQQAACRDPVILDREPHRARPPSPHTLDDWLRAFRRDGLLTFLRCLSSQPTGKRDCRRAKISPAAQAWVNSHWRSFDSPRQLYEALSKQATTHGWAIPGEQWLYRKWRKMPAIVQTQHRDGWQAYEARYAPYAPRDFTDLEALQVLCGDHSERDVTVLLKDGSLARPWLTIWFDLRTGLIWGWHLDLTPSSVTAGLAYADGVENFGAQPLARPDENFLSYVYTDRGRDYRSHHWDGRVLAVHEKAMSLEGGLEFVLTERRVGILAELRVKHLVARGYNAKEKPVERVHRDISTWERNTFAEYCGRDAKSRPERWRKLYEQHQRLKPQQRAASSPFIRLEAYREALAGYITGYNSLAHERAALGGALIVPLEEYQRLYQTRFEIAPETLALLLMKAEKRVVHKNGIQCFQKHWFYWHDKLSIYKGQSVEVRYSDGDYSRVRVILPGGEMCEAQLITPTSLLNPNKQTLQAVAQARARERKLIRDFQLLNQSALSGETTEDRVAQIVNEEQPDMPDVQQNEATPQTSVHLLMRLDHRRVQRAGAGREIDVAEVLEVEADLSIFDSPVQGSIREFDFDE